MCTIDECKGKVIAKGLCSKHYMRNYRATGPVCSMPECARSEYSGELCESHYKGDLRKRNPSYDAAQRAVDRETKELIAPGYRSIHNRVRYHRGTASEYICIDCGATAHTWSLSTFVNIKYGIPDRETYPYSDNINDYSPRCYSCHGKFDKNLRNI